MTEAGDSPAVRIVISNVMRSHKIDEYAEWATLNKYDFLFITEYAYKEADQENVNLITSESHSASVAIIKLNTELVTKCRFISDQHITIKLGTPPVMVHLWYIKPGDTDPMQLIIENNLTAHLKKVTRREIHTGDLNARSTRLGDTRTTARGRRILEAMNEGNFTIVNKVGAATFKHKGTHESDKGTSIIDWTIVTDDMEASIKWSAFPDHLGSDHHLIELEIATAVEHQDRTPLSKVSPAAFLKAIKKKTANADVSQWHTHYSEAVQEAKRQAAKRKLFNDDGLEHLRKQLNTLSKKMRRGEGDEEALKAEANEISKLLKKDKEEAEHRRWVEKVKSATDGVMYKELIADTSKTASCHHVATEQGRLDGVDAARCIVEKFYPEDTMTTFQLPEVLPPNDSPITFEEVNQALKSFKAHKAPGRSGVSFELLKQWHQNDPLYHHKLFSSWFEAGTFPSELKESIIKPLVKNRRLPPKLTNIRPIALTECLARWYEKILDVRLIYHIEKNKKLAESQHGYREQRDAIAAAEELIRARMRNRGRRTELLVQLDVRAAFDSIRHAAIINALVEAQTPGNLIKILQAYLTGRTATVVIDDAEASKVMCRGVPQGSCLGPHLYILTTDAILRAVEHRISLRQERTTLVSFADDIVLNIASNTTQAQLIKVASAYLTLISKHLQPLGLSLSVAKTKMMWTANEPILTTVKINGCDIEMVESVKVLGINFTHNNDFKEHVDELEEKVNKWLDAQAKLVKPMSGLSYKMRRKLVMTVLAPKVTYGAAVWWPHLTKESQNKMKKISTKAMAVVAAATKHPGNVSMTYLSQMTPVNAECELLARISDKIRTGQAEKNLRTTDLGHPALRRRGTYVPTVTTPEQIEAIAAQVKYFTDGSQMLKEAAKVTGAAYVRFETDQPPTAYMLKLGELNTVYQAELAAIKAALIDADQRRTDKAIAIFSDALAALDAITSPTNTNQLAHDCRQLYWKLNDEGPGVTLVHVKAHIGLVQNEIADAFAKQATTDGDDVTVPQSKRAIRTRCRDEIMQEVKTRLLRDPTGKTIKQFFDGIDDPLIKKAVINAYTTEVYTGHGLNLTSHRYGFRNCDNKCECGETQTMIHLITMCPNTIEQNLTIANRAGISTPDFLEGWERLRRHERLHEYIASRAPSLRKHLEKVNKLETDTHAAMLGLMYLHLEKAQQSIYGPLDNWFRLGNQNPAGAQGRSERPTRESVIYSDRGVVDDEVVARLGMEGGALIPERRGMKPGD